MSRPQVTIVDYQMGNLRSVQKALEHVGAEATITSDPEVIAAADRLILPGVGAFGDAMRELKSRSLVQPILDFIQTDKPFLGICLGLQLLFEVGEEGGTQPGLGVLAGRCVRFDLPHEYKVPHMGWNRVQPSQLQSVSQAAGSARLLADIEAEPYFYFVHSYYVVPTDPSLSWLTCDYGGSFCAAVSRGNLFATQFHPEKSQASGLKLLESFSAL